MSPEHATQLRALIHGRRAAALGTLHDGAPFVSMVPFALSADGSFMVIHVSRLAAHTRDMLADPRVSVLVMQAENEGVAPQALARVSIQGESVAIDGNSTDGAACREIYLARFPEAEPLLGFADFSFFAIRPSTARFVAGFAQAMTVSGTTLAQALR